MVKSVEEYPLPANQDYLSYYVYQGEWKPTRPIGPISAMASNPGPATVNLPSTIGDKRHDLTKAKAPACKIGMRLKTEITRIGPGPGLYDIRDVTNKGKDNPRAPKIGKADRFNYKKAPYTSVGPGPAAHSRQDGDRFIYRTAPSFTVPHSQRSKTATATTPGPNAYNLPPAIGPGKTLFLVGPAYSVGKARRMPDPKRQVNPGPAAYVLPSSNASMNKSPAWSMGSKAAPPSGEVVTPGPAAHSAHMVKYDKYSTPRITFGIKHSPYKAMPGFAAEK